MVPKRQRSAYSFRHPHGLKKGTLMFELELFLETFVPLNRTMIDKRCECLTHLSVWRELESAFPSQSQTLSE